MRANMAPKMDDGKRSSLYVTFARGFPKGITQLTPPGYAKPVGSAGWGGSPGVMSTFRTYYITRFDDFRRGHHTFFSGRSSLFHGRNAWCEGGKHGINRDAPIYDSRVAWLAWTPKPANPGLAWFTPRSGMSFGINRSQLESM